MCTIEKANVAINRLVKEGRLAELCCMVVDELHMVCDAQRGAALELSLTKLRYAEHAHGIQVSQITRAGTLCHKKVQGRWTWRLSDGQCAVLAAIASLQALTVVLSLLS